MEWIQEILNIVRNLVLMITVWDIIDMAIIAYLIYRVTLFLRKTNSTNVVKGIILLIAVIWLSSILHLNVINYLLGNAFEFGIIVIVILFQPELRRILEKVGSSNFRKFFNRSVETEAVESVISQTVIACEDMSKAKIGALIVFERSNNLDSYVNTGTIIDAAPAVELIKNIFFPKSPLHDGAAIIRNGRVMSAACMLPLSSNNNLSSDLGMRHRAGVGMSERSDAVVVIVSEETGSISVAVHGMLKRHLSVETFEKLLKNELVASDEEKSSKRRIFKRS